MTAPPNGWLLTTLEECVDVLDSRRIPVNSDERSERLGNIPYYGATGRVGWIDSHIFDEELLLVGEDGAPFFDKNKSIAYVISGPSWVNNHAHVLRAKLALTSNHYLRHYLNQFDFTGYVNGTTRLKLTQGAMNQIPIPLAPAIEQHRIVAKLNAVLARVHTSQQRLENVAKILKRFRQAVLAGACLGRLTADWRTQHTSPWQETTLAQVIDRKPQNGYSAKPVKNETPYRVLTLTATTSGVFDARHFKFFNEPLRADCPFWLQPGDILVQRGNTIEYVGVPAIYDGPPNQFIYPDLMMRFRANKRVTTEYLHLTLAWGRARNYLRERATGTAGSMPKINQQTLMSVPVNVPTIAEQQEIIRRVRALFRFADRLKFRLEKASEQVDRLAQSILAKAFRGELVPTEAELAAAERRCFESAEQLLERIQNTKNASSNAAKPKDNYPVRTGRRANNSLSTRLL